MKQFETKSNKTVLNTGQVPDIAASARIIATERVLDAVASARASS
jgi:hypothetical protein